MSIGRGSGAGMGALLGAGIGAVAGGLATYVATGTPELGSSEEGLAYTAVGAAGGLVVGAIVGLIVGSTSHPDRWEPSVWPVGTGVSMGMRITF